MVRGSVQRRRFSGGDPEALNGGGGHHGSLFVLYSYRPSADWLGWRRVDVSACPVVVRPGLPDAWIGAGCYCQLPGWNIRQCSLLTAPWRRCLQPNF